MSFRDRTEAGQALAKKLSSYAGRADVRLYALPRGGVVVGVEVAKALKLPLDLIVTRKLGAPENEEYAIGSLAETGQVIWNTEELMAHGQKALEPIIDRERKEAERRIKKYRHGRPLTDLKGQTVIIIDDGIATGLTIRAAIAAAKHHHASKIVLAAPNGARDTVKELKQQVDEVFVLEKPLFYGSVGGQYETFPQVTDEEVIEYMKIYGPK